ncbi:uncharacterized protein L201_002832 [Kwoniella dendrophila CBS 6074]|uniref:Protein kinase domain-containing protein n=1 Tax=Kwoniella dendrophila CBS 6074 TaxID=1295534 RepID=A0AAX4JRB9_9TREE
MTADISHPPTDIQTPEPQSAINRDQIITLSQYVHEGDLWDFWIGNIECYGQVILKVVDTFNYPCSDPKLDEYVPYQQITTEATREQNFYNGPLRRLQGTVIPKYFGIFSSGRKNRYLAMLLEFAGWSIGSGYIEMHENWVDDICEAYKHIHLCGISQRDLDGRHILVHPNENGEYRIRIVGFRHAKHRKLTDETGVTCLLEEAAAIRSRYAMVDGMEPSIMKALPEYWAQLDDPEDFRAELDDLVVDRGYLPPEVIAHNQRRGAVYTHDGLRIL